MFGRSNGAQKKHNHIRKTNAHLPFPKEKERMSSEVTKKLSSSSAVIVNMHKKEAPRGEWG